MRLPSLRPAARLGFAACLSLTLLAACRQTRESEPDRRGETSAVRIDDSRITVTQSGGITGATTTATIDGGSLTWTVVTRRGCAADAPCPAADSASGPIPERDARAIFGTAAEQWDSLLESYGRSERGADLITYEFDIRLEGREKHTSADDVTLPPDLRMLRDRVFQAIDSARGR